MTPDNQGSPFVLFKKDCNKDCFWILFLRKWFVNSRGIMATTLEKDKRMTLIDRCHVYIYGSFHSICTSSKFFNPDTKCKRVRFWDLFGVHFSPFQLSKRA